MITNGIITLFRTTTTTALQRRLASIISSLTVRLLIAFAISWLILLVFFASGAVSH